MVLPGEALLLTRGFRVGVALVVMPGLLLLLLQLVVLVSSSCGTCVLSEMSHALTVSLVLMLAMMMLLA